MEETNQGGSSGVSEMQLDSVYILMVEAIITDRLNTVWSMRERGESGMTPKPWDWYHQLRRGR